MSTRFATHYPMLYALSVYDYEVVYVVNPITNLSRFPKPPFPPPSTQKSISSDSKLNNVEVCSHARHIADPIRPETDIAGGGARDNQILQRPVQH